MVWIVLHRTRAIQTVLHENWNQLWFLFICIQPCLKVTFLSHLIWFDETLKLVLYNESVTKICSCCSFWFWNFLHFFSFDFFFTFQVRLFTHPCSPLQTLSFHYFSPFLSFFAFPLTHALRCERPGWSQSDQCWSSGGKEVNVKGNGGCLGRGVFTNGDFLE